MKTLKPQEKNWNCREPAGNQLVMSLESHIFHWSAGTKIKLGDRSYCSSPLTFLEAPRKHMSPCTEVNLSFFICVAGAFHLWTLKFAGLNVYCLSRFTGRVHSAKVDHCDPDLLSHPIRCQRNMTLNRDTAISSYGAHK